MTAVFDRARRLAPVEARNREIALHDAPVGESPYSLLQQVNAALSQSCQPFVVWLLEWIRGEVDRLWPDGVPQIRNEHASAYVTSYAYDDAGNPVYLGMVRHKTVLESIRVTVQTRQRKKFFLKSRPVYLLATHDSQTWKPEFLFFRKPAGIWRESRRPDCRSRLAGQVAGGGEGDLHTRFRR